MCVCVYVHIDQWNMCVCGLHPFLLLMVLGIIFLFGFDCRLNIENNGQLYSGVGSQAAMKPTSTGGCLVMYLGMLLHLSTSSCTRTTEFVKTNNCSSTLFKTFTVILAHKCQGLLQR